MLCAFQGDLTSLWMTNHCGQILLIVNSKSIKPISIQLLLRRIRFQLILWKPLGPKGMCAGVLYVILPSVTGSIKYDCYCFSKPVTQFSWGISWKYLSYKLEETIPDCTYRRLLLCSQQNGFILEQVWLPESNHRQPVRTRETFGCAALEERKTSSNPLFSNWSWTSGSWLPS